VAVVAEGLRTVLAADGHSHDATAEGLTPAG
jgi:hypothetical protein